MNASPICDDAEQHESIVKVIKSAQLVTKCIGPFYQFGAKALRAAIDAGVDYADICDDYSAAREILGLDEEARRAGLTAVTSGFRR